MTTKHGVLLAEDDRNEVDSTCWALQHAGLPHQIIDLPDRPVTIEYLKGNPPWFGRKASRAFEISTHTEGVRRQRQGQTDCFDLSVVCEEIRNNSEKFLNARAPVN